MYLMEEINSSLIREIEYDEDTEELTVRFRKYYTDELTYIGVPFKYFMQFSEEKSMGKFYLRMIKPNFKQKTDTMSDSKKPKGINRASDEKRFIKLSIDVTAIEKQWLFQGETGKVYLNATLAMLPDGEVDKYENLGMITQDVPKAIFEKEVKAKVPPEKRTKGKILGNGAEWERKAVSEGRPGQETEKMGVDDINDDLPF